MKTAPFDADVSPRERVHTPPDSDVWTLPATAQDLALHVRRQRSEARPYRPRRGAVLYVHGATFPSALSLFFRFDGASWADALNAAGFDAWGFDFAGYGHSQRYREMTQPADAAPPLGRIDTAARQLDRVLQHALGVIAAENERPALHLIAHSWGSLVALRAASARSDALASLTLFGPPVQRDAPPAPEVAMHAWRTLTIWEQYRRFVADVPRGEPAVMLDRHIEAWSRAYLATDAHSGTREPPAVRVPAGPMADIADLWSGRPLVDAAQVHTSTLLVRGAWDSVCDDRDAARLLGAMTGTTARDCVLPKGTHLMHLETGRIALHRAVNEFLLERTR